MTKLWGGRFKEDLDHRVLKFSSSLGFDKRLLPYDIRGSIAHARMLQKIGILSAEEGKTLTGALKEILDELMRDPPGPEEAEDIHSLVENRLKEKVGDLAGKLHTARSRNDQVALDMKLYLRDVNGSVLSALKNFRKTLLGRAEENLDAIMPGFTHLQPAQPVLLAHHLMAYFEMFGRDCGRFLDAQRRSDELPLGAGALAGSSIPIDRDMVAGELEFGSVSRNSMDSVSERDFLLEFASAAAVAMVHLSRLAEELVLWSSPAYGFVTLPDRIATGSSMMPQKKNPDVAELVRGKSGRVFGHLMALLTMLKGLPLAYQRDLQEDKEAVFDCADTILSSIEAMDLLLSGIEFNKDKMASEAGRGHTVATDLAEYLAARGVPFRDAHRIIGEIVRQAISSGRNIDELAIEEIQAHSELLEADVLRLMTPAGSVENKKSFGSTAPSMVSEAIKKARESLESEEGPA